MSRAIRVADITCAVPGCGRPIDCGAWCHGHYEQHRRDGVIPTTPFADTPFKRFFARVDFDGECWIWTGATGGDGRYGRFDNLQAHAWAYQQFVGALTPGLEFDHLCRRTLCVNPRHVEPVTHWVNVIRGIGVAAANIRKTHCFRGHELTPENVRPMKNGGRACLTCEREVHRPKGAEYMRRKRAALKAQQAEAAS